MAFGRARRLSTYRPGLGSVVTEIDEDPTKKGGYEMTAQEIDEALFREEMAQDAFRVDQSPANKTRWEQARVLVDRAIREVS